MSRLKQVTDNLERIGTIGSPSTTTELTIDILGKAATKKLVGELALFEFHQDNNDHIALGQITDVELRNCWLEDPTMRSLARQRGQVNPVSGAQDIHLGEMTVSAVFQEDGAGFNASLLGTVPQTGTFVKLASDELLNTLLQRHKNEIFYLGNVYGSQPNFPMWFKHFDKSSQSSPGGAGEAYHLGIFGKTGSGKTTLAQMCLLGYAKHRNMSVFILDPQGQLSKGLRRTMLIPDMGEVFSQGSLAKLNRQFSVFDLSKIILSDWNLFFNFLTEFGFFFDLGIKDAKYQAYAADYLEDFCRENDEIKMDGIGVDELVQCLDFLAREIGSIYSGQKSQGALRVQDKIKKVKQAINAKANDRIVVSWNKVAKLFKAEPGKMKPRQILAEAISSGQNKRIISIDLSIKPENISQQTWDENIKPLIIKAFLQVMNDAAETAYQQDKSLNTLIVIDEAHRLAPRGRIENEKKEKIRGTLIDAVRTTRKYGLGWMFISQTLSSLDKDIIDQLRINFFGFGLSMGSEFQALKELAGGDQNALRLYQSFKDPHSAFNESSKQYSFMTVGPVSPLSFAGTPLFLTAFSSAEKFYKINGI